MEVYSLAGTLRLLRSGKADLKIHSGRVLPGDVFVVLPGGEQYIADAIARGAGVVVAAPETAASIDAPVRVVSCAAPRTVLGRLARVRYRTTDLGFPVIGITGTNGKTTITYLLEAFFSALGKRVGVMGTINYRWPGFEEPAPLTTPDCLTLHANLARMREAGVEVAAMEVSSHALDQERVAGINFSGAIFTNLTQDHLDYHAGMDDYFDSKTKLFKAPYARLQFAAINADCAYGRKLLAGHRQALGFGLTPPKGKRPYLHGEILSLTPQGLRLRMTYAERIWELKSKLVGAFNASNLLAVQALTLALGYKPEQFKVLENFSGVPGRLERIDNPQGLAVFVDYSHTPDALINAQRTLKDAGFKRLITVFGCGGNRDRGKRPLMGKAVADFADIAVLTSDNPRREDPLAILDDIRPGLAACPQVVEEVDRRKAIAKAIALLKPGDALLVAGKGHEDYQIIGDTKYPFSDQAVIREVLKCN